MAKRAVTEDMLDDGFMFDGSSIAGWKAINESDMTLNADLDAVYMDPFSATPMMILLCAGVEPSIAEPYPRDPLPTATPPYAFQKDAGNGDTAYFGTDTGTLFFSKV